MLVKIHLLWKLLVSKSELFKNHLKIDLHQFLAYLLPKKLLLRTNKILFHNQILKWLQLKNSNFKILTMNNNFKDLIQKLKELKMSLI